MSDQDELQHFMEVEVALNNIIAEHGVSFTWLSKMRKELASAIPPEGIEYQGYKFTKVVKGAFLRKNGDGKAFFNQEVVQCSKVK